MYLVPGHRGIKRNERVDTLEKEGVLPNNTVMLEILIALQALKRQCELDMLQEADKRWPQQRGCKISRAMLTSHDLKLTKTTKERQKISGRFHNW